MKRTFFFFTEAYKN